MSELPRSTAQLSRSSPQLPVASYFDEGLLARERAMLFDRGPGYVGHELMVPEQGDFHTLDWAGHGQMLVRNANGIELMSNVCRHRQALMLQGRGNARSVVCPLHRWSYDLQGKLLGAPHFAEQPCLSLPRKPLQRWNGLLFAGERDVARDLASLGCIDDFDFSGYMLDRVEVKEYQHNWKTFVEVYLEDYHVIPFHPGLGSFVNCDELRWEFGEEYSVQVVGVNAGLRHPGTPVYAKWHEAVKRFTGNRQPRHGAIWMVYYPNVMLEWYPHVLIVSTLLPRGPQHTTNIVEFYYPEEIVLFEREFVEAEQAAYAETALEDDEIARRMEGGRRALMQAGLDDRGPYQSPMEDGMLHFHEYLQRKLGPLGIADTD
jgi:phenylpropionate dioxygenase-like ring-hydroxylating dioxygenase large terminal subunit